MIRGVLAELFHLDKIGSMFGVMKGVLIQEFDKFYQEIEKKEN
jgi:hypothetical protein